MSIGLRKAKKYDWKDSNLALFGSELEHKVKQAAATQEPAWTGVGQQPELRVWRIEQFKVKPWPERNYGNFYDGDSYIILKVTKVEDARVYHVHFWIGKYSTADEYGTAAYKTVELDQYLKDQAIEHREVQGFESDLFKSYFPRMVYWIGGADSGFNHVVPEAYVPRLLRFEGSLVNVKIADVPFARSSLNSGSCYVVDLGLTLYQWNGKESSGGEKFKAGEYREQLENERAGKVITSSVVEESDVDPGWYAGIGMPDASEAEEADNFVDVPKQLFRLSDEAGKLQTYPVEYSRNSLKSDDVFIVDHPKTVNVWIGSKASIEERRLALSKAHQFLQSSPSPCRPVTVTSEGKEDKVFNLVWE
eukprot:NODE_3965_length_1252_cov_80.061116_g3478_i0.p1 GENE.NODE_3965_length_1252_cov_80.061116_g3478_i0~~NODE_3965_length_1252_cov_80.061116_g3478_i0.p1  ORF type:complete len:382 (-),score=87.11 NODE_3965_length_1252_cov_80.061116_g3478_i0:107-1192(-)